MEEYFDIIGSCSLFRDIKKDELSGMLACLGAKTVSFDKKYTVFSEGSPAKYVGIMLSGSAQITRTDYYGNRSIISNVEPSEVFGEAFACAGVDSMPVSIVAKEPCEVMLIDIQRIIHPCQNACGFHQQLIFNMMRDLAMKNLSLHARTEVTSKRSTREKLLAYLMLEAKIAKSNSFEIPFDRQELADFLEVDRSGLSTEIGRLKAEGIIENRKNKFTLL